MKTRKTTTKLLAFLLCLGMLATFSVFAVGADASDDEGYTMITNESELRAIAENLEGKYKLANDIYLTMDWVPITGFKGTLDGNGYDIHDLSLVDVGTTAYAKVGFFGTLLEGAVVKNLAIHGSIQNDYWVKMYIGGIVAEARTGSTIENCVSYVNITNGILAYNTYAGGIAGAIQQGVTIKNCINEGDITITSDPSNATGWRHFIGGITGFIQGTAETDALIENCVNRGTISVSDKCEDDTYIAGIIGNICHENGTVTVTKCVNYGTINGATHYVAGIVGGHKYDLVSKTAKP